MLRGTHEGLWRRRLLAAGILAAGITAGLTSGPSRASDRFGQKQFEAARVRTVEPQPMLILQRNVTAAVILAAGLVSAGAMSGFGLFVIGWTLAAGLERSIAFGLPSSLFVAGTLPHAIFEVPGFVLAGAAGCSGWEVVRALLRSQDGAEARVRMVLFNASRELLLAAACIGTGALVEAYITPRVFMHTLRTLSP